MENANPDTPQKAGLMAMAIVATEVRTAPAPRTNPDPLTSKMLLSSISASAATKARRDAAGHGLAQNIALSTRGMPTSAVMTLFFKRYSSTFEDEEFDVRTPPESFSAT